MLLIYQMNFYKWYFRVAGHCWFVQKYESMSNRACQRPFEWDLSGGRRSNSIEQFWWTSFGQSSSRFRALHHREFRKCHGSIAYRAASRLLFYIYVLILGTTDESEWSLMGIYSMCAFVSTSTMIAQQQSANWPSCSAPHNRNEISSTTIHTN